MEKIAVIDIGSNSVRLVIFEVNAKGFKVIDDMKETVRLGEGLDESQHLSISSMDKAILTLQMFKRVCLSSGARIIAVATAAMRKADNSLALIQRIEEETGIMVRIISGEEEAYLDYLGVIHSIDIKDGVIMDIGGGSTELVHFKDRQLIEVTSLPFGSLDLMRRFNLSQQVLTENEMLLHSFLLDSFRKVSWINKVKGPLIGVGGIIRNIGKIDRKRKKYPLDIAHNYVIDLEDISEIYNTAKVRQNDQDQMEGLSSERTDIFVGANAAVKLFMETAGIKKLVTSGYGLREGIIFNELFDSPRLQQSVLDTSLENLINIYQVDKRHAFHVYSLYNKLFYLLQDIHGIEDDMSRINKAAAYLHDIGVNIRFYDHHEHTFYLILNIGVNGLSHRELVLCAHLAASHRIKKFKSSLEDYKLLLNKGDKLLVRKAGILLQIANSLDRSMDGKVKDIHCKLVNNSVILYLDSEGNSELEKKDAMQAADHFKKIFNIDLIIL